MVDPVLGRGAKTCAFPHSGVLWSPRLPATCPDVGGQLHRGLRRAVQLHWQADAGGKCYPHVWAGWTLDWLPATLLRYGAWYYSKVDRRNAWQMGSG